MGLIPISYQTSGVVFSRKDAKNAKKFTTKLCTSPTMTGSSARGRAAPGDGKTPLLLKAPDLEIFFAILAGLARENGFESQLV
jgi:hypothetical protein